MSAEDVIDLDQARQIITHLRATIVRMDEESRPIEGEYSVFLGKLPKAKGPWALLWRYSTRVEHPSSMAGLQVSPGRHRPDERLGAFRLNLEAFYVVKGS